MSEAKAAKALCTDRGCDFKTERTTISHITIVVPVQQWSVSMDGTPTGVLVSISTVTCTLILLPTCIDQVPTMNSEKCC
jgi:hypothetical protein